MAEIFTEPVHGTVETLLADIGNAGHELPGLTKTILRQILQSLDYLHRHMQMVHRDVKPSNILYTQSNYLYRFQLANFGYAHHIYDQTQAGTLPGTPTYMAPEIFYGPECPQLISKADVWSLYVTMLWVMNVEQFRHRCNQDGAQSAIFRASRAGIVSEMQEMAVPNPNLRASAAGMLVKLFPQTRIQ
jgi:serine/threonine protein kinase